MITKRVSYPVRYDSLENHVTEQIDGSTDQQQARYLSIIVFLLLQSDLFF
jgi:hypothetical protein